MSVIPAERHTRACTQVGGSGCSSSDGEQRRKQGSAGRRGEIVTVFGDAKVEL